MQHGCKIINLNVNATILHLFKSSISELYSENRSLALGSLLKAGIG